MTSHNLVSTTRHKEKPLWTLDIVSTTIKTQISAQICKKMKTTLIIEQQSDGTFKTLNGKGMIQFQIPGF